MFAPYSFWASFLASPHDENISHASCSLFGRSRSWVAVILDKMYHSVRVSLDRAPSKKQRAGSTSFGHMSNVRLLAHIAAIQSTPTTLAEAVPIFLKLTAAVQTEPCEIIVDPDLLEEYFRKFVHPTAIAKPFAIPQYLPDRFEPDFVSFWAGMEDISHEIKNVIAYEPITTPFLKHRRDSQRYFRARWRGQWMRRLTYYYPSTQVLQKQKPVKDDKRKPRVYFHLMRHGEVHHIPP